MFHHGRTGQSYLDPGSLLATACTRNVGDCGSGEGQKAKPRTDLAWNLALCPVLVTGLVIVYVIYRADSAVAVALAQAGEEELREHGSGRNEEHQEGEGRIEIRRKGDQG